MVCAKHIGGDFQQIGKQIGNIPKHPTRDIVDAQIDVPGLPLDIQHDGIIVAGGLTTAIYLESSHAFPFLASSSACIFVTVWLANPRMDFSVISLFS